MRAMQIRLSCSFALAFGLAVHTAGQATEPSQTKPQVAASSTSATSATSATPAASAAEGNAPVKRVIEDDKVRIEETRMRGQTQSVTVQSKLPGVKAYEVIMPPLGKDPSQDKGAAGKRTWSLFDF
jgi:uncharacterized secreted protein with C-terminal beta-propeller domain